MSWLVYILQSEVDGDYYKGVTQNIETRLLEHNSGESKFTSTKLPWNLVY
jgi:putative endonuclease